MVERICGNCSSCTLTGILGRTWCDRYNKAVSDNKSGCSHFVSDEEITCGDCEYQGWKDGAFGLGGYAICKLKNKKIIGGDKACSCFEKFTY